jgi:hypothetical protein
MVVGGFSHTEIRTATQTSPRDDELSDTFAYYEDCANCRRDRNGNELSPLFIFFCGLKFGLLFASAVLMIIYTVLFYLWNIAASTYASFPLPGLMMSKVYSNSMLVLLNNRITIVKGRNAVESFEFVEVSPLQVLQGEMELQKRGGHSRTGAKVQRDDGS